MDDSTTNQLLIAIHDRLKSTNGHLEHIKLIMIVILMGLLDWFYKHS